MKSHIINVLDLELSCYPDGVFPPGEQKEIIEVGLATLNLRTRTIVRTISMPVIPTMSRISPFCTALTGWTEAKLRRQGMPMGEVCRLLAEKHGALNRLLATDTSGDPEFFLSQCRLMGIAFPFGPERLNVSTLFALLTGEMKNLGLALMLEKVGLTFEGLPHRGDNDARNIARLLLKLIENSSFPLADEGGTR